MPGGRLPWRPTPTTSSTSGEQPMARPMRCRGEHITGPLPSPSSKILPRPHAEPLLHTPYLVGSCHGVPLRSTPSGHRSSPGGGSCTGCNHHYDPREAWRGVKPRTARWQPFGQVGRSAVCLSERPTLPLGAHPHPAYSSGPDPEDSAAIPRLSDGRALWHGANAGPGGAVLRVAS